MQRIYPAAGDRATLSQSSPATSRASTPRAPEAASLSTAIICAGSRGDRLESVEVIISGTISCSRCCGLIHATQELGFVDRFNAERPRLLELAACVCSHDDEGRG